MIVKGYALTEDEERALLEYFRSSDRPVPSQLARREYSPASVKDGIAFAELAAITEDWEETNAKRCQLIEKRARDKLSDSETEECEHLQKLADKRLQFFAPYQDEDIDTMLESMHAC